TFGAPGLGEGETTRGAARVSKKIKPAAVTTNSSRYVRSHRATRRRTAGRVTLSGPPEGTQILSGAATTMTFSGFFQAEDGIRDGHVTGVQTCALPISRDRYYGSGSMDVAVWRRRNGRPPLFQRDRSEERRVGKEGRSRWAPYH